MSATAADDGDLGGMRMEEEVEDEDEVEEEEDSADPEPFYDESEIFFERIGFNQMFGPQTGGCPLQHTQFNQETCASSQMPTLPSEVVPRVQVGQELGQQMGMQIEVGDSSAARSVSIIQSLLAKQKSSGVNAMKPPTGKWRKSSNMPIVRSPLLKRRLMSPRMGHSGLKNLRPPSVSVDGSPSAMQNRAASPSLPPAIHDLCHDFKQQGAGREKIPPRFPGDSLKRVQVAALYWRTILLLILLSSSC